MKITLVHGRYFNSWEALGLGYLGAYIKKHDPSIEVNFFQGCFDTDEEILAGAHDSDIVCFSCTSPSFTHVETIGRKLKEINPAIHTVVGGYHASALPDECLIPGAIDQVVIGEGEYALIDIIQGNRAPKIYAERVKFEDLPWPDRELIRADRNMEVAFKDNGYRITSFQCHRSCPFACRFCADGRSNILVNHLKDKTAWYRDIDDVLDEMEHYNAIYDIGQAKFSDPTWNTSVEWATEFSRRKIERGIKLEFYPNIHARQVTQEMTDLMKEAGCDKIAMGIESGSPKVLRAIGKGTKVESIMAATRFFQKSDIEVRGFFIVGMPCETNEDLEMTEAFADELDLDEYGFTILCPYPGTYLYDHAKHKDVDWAKTDEYGNDFWTTETLSNQDLHNWQDRLVKHFEEKICWHNRVILDER